THAPYEFSGNTAATSNGTSYVSENGFNGTTAFFSTPGPGSSHTITHTFANLTLAASNTSIGGALNNQYEIMAFGAQPRAPALGITTNTTGFTSQSLQSLWPDDTFSAGDYSEHPWHNAEFEFDAASQDAYWNELLFEFGIPRNH
ncbi:MAG TPA: hypothetical protein VK737_09980, partial [Opitutales bacterium]|nr:hypothetical protein [Opitutales bacterium]